MIHTGQHEPLTLPQASSWGVTGYMLAVCARYGDTELGYDWEAEMCHTIAQETMGKPMHQEISSKVQYFRSFSLSDSCLISSHQLPRKVRCISPMCRGCVAHWFQASTHHAEFSDCYGCPLRTKLISIAVPVPTPLHADSVLAIVL